MKIKIGIIFLSLLLFSVIANAQNISISATVDKTTVSQDDSIILRVTLTGDVNDLPSPQLPALTGFTSYSSGRSQNISIVNGKVSASLVYNYVLSPRAPGNYTIGKITVSFKGKIYSTEPIQLSVVKSSSHANVTSPSPGAQAGAGQQVSGAQNKQYKDIFITTSVDKKRAYVNEPITLIFRFFTRVNLLSSPEYQAPDTTGFWAEDLPPQKTFYNVLNGMKYRVTEIKTALFPITNGSYTIGSASVRCNIEDFSSDNTSSDDFFRSFFSRGKAVTLRANPIKIKVLPLPSANKPSSFTGTVGRYTMSVSVDRHKLEVGDALNYIVAIQGEGNIKSIGDPVLKETEKFKKYDTITSIDISKEKYKVHGKKIFKTVIVPRVSGILELPKVEFSYFDINTKKYKTIVSRPIKITALPRTKQKQETSPETQLLTDDIKIVGKDIRFILENTHLCSTKKLLVSSKFFWVIVFMFPLIYFGLIFRTIYIEKVMNDPVKLKQRKAMRIMTQRLLKAQKSALKDEKNAIQIASNALIDYFSMKLNLPISGLNVRAVEEELEKRDIDVKVVFNEVRDIWESLDFMRFAPGAVKDKAEIKHVIINLKKSIIRLDSIINRS